MMSANFDLLSERWVPTTAGRVSIETARTLPATALCTGRVDLDFALLLFLIGLQNTGYRPPPIWSPGTGERFLQDPEALSGPEALSVNQLLVDEPTNNALKKVWGRPSGIAHAFCLPCASIALLTRVFIGPLGGKGYRPSPLAGCLVYLIDGPTVGDLVAANRTPEPVPEAVYFGAANHYWLGDPEDEAHCGLCGQHGPVIRKFHRKTRSDPLAVEASDNPHAAYNREKNTRHAEYMQSSFLRILQGIIDPVVSPRLLQPVPYDKNIRYFGTFYDKHNLIRLASGTVYMAEYDWDNIRNALKYQHAIIRHIWLADVTKGPVDVEAGHYGVIANYYANLVLDGMGFRRAARTAFDDLAPSVEGIHTSATRSKPWLAHRKQLYYLLENAG